MSKRDTDKYTQCLFKYFEAHKKINKNITPEKFFAMVIDHLTTTYIQTLRLRFRSNKSELLFLMKIVPFGEYQEYLRRGNVGLVPQHSFPGAYFVLVNNRMLYSNFWLSNMSPHLKSIGSNGVILLFSLNLLRQKNWHLNVHTNAGYVYNQTYFAHEFHKKKTMEFSKLNKVLDDPLAQFKGNRNEVVFHDPVSLDFLCGVYATPMAFYQNAPNKPCVKGNPNLRVNPFYAYPVGQKTYVNPNPDFHIDFYRDLCTISSSKRKCSKAKNVKEINEIMFTQKRPWGFYRKKRSKQNLRSFRKKKFRRK